MDKLMYLQYQPQITQGHFSLSQGIVFLPLYILTRRKEWLFPNLLTVTGESLPAQRFLPMVRTQTKVLTGQNSALLWPVLCYIKLWIFFSLNSKRGMSAGTGLVDATECHPPTADPAELRHWGHLFTDFVFLVPHRQVVVYSTNSKNQRKAVGERGRRKYQGEIKVLQTVCGVIKSQRGSAVRLLSC